MPLIDVDGHRIAYAQAGTGPAVVLLHGYVGDGEATWHPQLRDLRDDFTLVAWDAPGAGRSSDPLESLGLSGYADALALFLTGLGLTRPHLVGLSFGGILALEFCTRHPGRVQTVSLVSAYAGWAGSLGEDLANTRLVQAMRLSELPSAEFVDSLLPTMFRTGTPQPVMQRFADSMRSFHPVGFRAMARASAGDLRAVLPQVRVPTLVISGADDARAPLKVAMNIQGAIAGSTLVVIPDSGHLCNLEQADPFNETVRAFLSKHLLGG